MRSKPGDSDHDSYQGITKTTARIHLNLELYAMRCDQNREMLRSQSPTVLRFDGLVDGRTIGFADGKCVQFSHSAQRMARAGITRAEARTYGWRTGVALSHTPRFRTFGRFMRGERVELPDVDVAGLALSDTAAMSCDSWAAAATRATVSHLADSRAMAADVV
jgi:hypothetical protein